VIQLWAKRLLVTVLVAVVLGPIIVGGTAMVIILSLGFMGYGIGSLTSSEAILGGGVGALYYIYFSYYVGSPIALIAGLLVGVTWIFWRPPSLVIVLAASILATFIWLLMVGDHFFRDFLIESPLAAMAAVGCWLLSRRYVSRI
jgi:hypothetical protein